MRKKSEPSVVEGWTKSRYNTFIRSALRRAWTKFPNKYTVANKGRKKMPNAKGREVWHQKCDCCGRWFQQKHMTVDHIIPCGQFTEFEHLPEFVEKLFCPLDNLQNLCNYKLAEKDEFCGDTACHYKKTQSERKKK